ncbi:MAG: hypothetical protein Ct9H300mP18_01180 [Candidatus Neomarinimicrobiota bacterium]|nr:MAG: hypothetical protein Ct9H300mP18_01180 [Candidatus Neomarinimicrobiota bacterium]
MKKLEKINNTWLKFDERIKTVLDNHGIQLKKEMNLDNVLMAIEVLKENNKQITAEKIYRDDISISEHKKKRKITII